MKTIYDNSFYGAIIAWASFSFSLAAVNQIMQFITLLLGMILTLITIRGKIQKNDTKDIKD